MGFISLTPEGLDITSAAFQRRNKHGFFQSPHIRSSNNSYDKNMLFLLPTGLKASQRRNPSFPVRRLLTFTLPQPCSPASKYLQRSPISVSRIGPKS
ncbi:hypothetical protein EYC84_005514 [Monilinia fructicola]|uniref:Uncharacterized protein n=1 Tax=Monilinia fructicola TaxID=38448 RepID=A0A5M9JWQ1_MONFR|nr:hypothetical protein EYC84_005514 [Monilinia fructicola]